MSRPLAVLGLFALMLAACSSGPVDTQRVADRDEAYVPVGSNIPRRESRRPEVATRAGEPGEPGAPGAATTTR